MAEHPINIYAVKVSKIQDSISIFIALAQTIDLHFQIMKKERNNKKSVVYAAVSTTILLQACSFMDEWKHLGATCKNETRLVALRKNLKPLTNRINQWSDLRSIRNTFIAHNLRDKKNDNENVLLKSYSTSLNIPDTFGDYLLLCGCIQFIFRLLIREFKAEYEELYQLHLRSLKHPPVNPGILSEKEGLKELLSLLGHVQQNLREWPA
jgi:hypothetical protein